MKIKLPDFSQARVLVVGDLMLDRYWYGETSRISPEAPVPVVHVGNNEERVGGAGNVALNIAKLGAQATVLGLTGDDEQAKILESLLEAASVQCQFEKLQGYSTITKLRVLSRHQQLLRMDFEDGFCGYDPSGLMRRYQSQLGNCDTVVFSDYGKGSLASVQEMIQLARKQNKAVIVDPKGSDFSKYHSASLITPNMHEFEAVVGLCGNESEIHQRGERLRASLNLESLLITRSEKGMTLIAERQEAHTIPTRAKEVFDVTGAGDTVVAVLAAAYASGGHSWRDAMAIANLAAGIVVGKLGTATVSVTELQQALEEHAPTKTGVVSTMELVELVVSAKLRNETIVMTNGCFDILHQGHVTYLQQAKALGDRLIVAVNSDASVQGLKGDGRPFNELQSRMAVLAALASVDWVVPFSEDTPQQLICRVLPDILVKGGDYQVDQIAGADCVIANGGEVKILPFVEGFSTTNTLKRVLAAQSAKLATKKDSEE